MSRRTSGTAAPAVQLRVWLRRLAPWLGTSLAAIAIVAVHTQLFPVMSQVDELSHFDYVQRAAHFEQPRVGDSVREPALRELACRGLDRGDPLPACDAPVLDPLDFPEFGQNSTAGSFPTYYFITGMFARLIVAASPVDSMLQASRLAGGLWLAAGLLAIGALLKSRGVSLGVRVGVLSIVALTPAVLHASAVVGSDASLLLVGAGVFMAFDRVQANRWPFWTVIPVLLLALSIDRAAMLAIGVSVLASLFVVATRPAIRGRGAALLLTVGLVVVIFGVGAGPARDAVFGSSTDPVPSPTVEQRATQHVATEIQLSSPSVDQISSNLTALLSPVSRPYVPLFLQSAGTTAVIELQDLLLMLGAGIIAFGGAGIASQRSHGLDAKPVGIAVWVLMLSGPLVAMFNYWSNGSYYYVNARFGLGFLPAILLCVALAGRVRGFRVIIWCVAGITIANALVVAFTASPQRPAALSTEVATAIAPRLEY